MLEKTVEKHLVEGVKSSADFATNLRVRGRKVSPTGS